MSWAEVVKKPKRRGGRHVASLELVRTQAQQKIGMRSRPPEILVNVSRYEFPALAKKLRGGVSKEVIGSYVVSMR